MVVLVFMMLIGAILETLGISMIYPVMNIVMERMRCRSMLICR